ncbi:hypothetical protein OG301_22555 [Streptomyces platensis]|uniref:hypothetical protein n=1 Tax=Streptomyces platensis TaxID=58346 RepID=UPI002ED4BDCC|nr:hypothetical protein OG301_22555 [Streptomyces platensis]
MAEMSSLSRGALGAYRGARFGRKIMVQRRWFAHLRYRAVVLALIWPETGIVPRRVHEAALILCDVLADSPLLEARGGLFSRVGRWYRQRVAWGIRYPDYRGPARATFWRRLYEWARNAADTRTGRDALALAEFEGGDDPSHSFAMRFVASTSAVLLDAGIPEELNKLRDDMVNEIYRGESDAEMHEKHRRLQVVVRAMAGGVASAALSYFGFHNDLMDVLGLGAVGVGVTAAADVMHGRISAFSEEILAARRQARDWLGTLSAWLVGYVVWAEDSLRRREFSGVDELVHVLTALASNDARIAEAPPDNAILAQVEHLLETAERAHDSELKVALFNIQGALMFRRDSLPDSIANLIALVQGVPDVSGMNSVQAFSAEYGARQISDRVREEEA